MFGFKITYPICSGKLIRFHLPNQSLHLGPHCIQTFFHFLQNPNQLRSLSESSFVHVRCCLSLGHYSFLFYGIDEL
nr:hypothetical protein Iba_chr01cCG15190 [Ipomoea batatas]